jgi:hypothetical protein
MNVRMELFSYAADLRSAAYKRPDRAAPRREMVLAGIEMLSEGTILLADGTDLVRARNRSSQPGEVSSGRVCHPTSGQAQSEVDTSGRQTYGFSVEIKLKSEIPANLFLPQDFLERIRVLTMADLNDFRRKGVRTETSVQLQREPGGPDDPLPKPPRPGVPPGEPDDPRLPPPDPDPFPTPGPGPLSQACRVPSVEYSPTDRSGILTNQSRPFTIR